jgi:hypothetical protein
LGVEEGVKGAGGKNGDEMVELGVFYTHLEQMR